MMDSLRKTWRSLRQHGMLATLRKIGSRVKATKAGKKGMDIPASATKTTLGALTYRCNICGHICHTLITDLGREKPSCSCGSTVRLRSIVHILSMELFGHSLALPDFPVRPDLRGMGMSDGVYADLLEKKLSYVNTFFHREPRLDITVDPDPELLGSLDFLISSEVFEHIAPPVSRGFENAHRLLKPRGVFIFTVPYVPEGNTTEHFPELYQYELQEKAGASIMKNVTREGREQYFDNLVFHGGPGATLEMRVFSRTGLLTELRSAGFGDIKIYAEPCWEYGIYWPESWSLPLSARAVARNVI